MSYAKSFQIFLTKNWVKIILGFGFLLFGISWCITINLKNLVFRLYFSIPVVVSRRLSANSFHSHIFLCHWPLREFYILLLCGQQLEFVKHLRLRTKSRFQNYGRVFWTWMPIGLNCDPWVLGKAFSILPLFQGTKANIAAIISSSHHHSFKVLWDR